jgi:hypothetical protein
MATPVSSGPTPRLPPVAATGPIPTDIPRTVTARAVERIRTSVTLYLLAPMLSAIYTLLVTAVVRSTGAYVAANFGGGPIFGGFVESDSLLITIPGSAFVLVSLAVTIGAWVTWSRGIRELADASGEFGGPQVAAARQAQKDYRRTVYTWFGLLVFGIVGAAVVIIVFLNAIPAGLSSGPANATAAAHAISSAFALLVVVTVVSVVLTVVVYHFATRSLVGAIGTIASPALQARLRHARSVILAGALLGLLADATLVSPTLYVLAAVGPLLLAIGFLRMRFAYSGWLTADPPPPGAAGSGLLPVTSVPPPAPPRGAAPPGGPRPLNIVPDSRRVRTHPGTNGGNSERRPEIPDSRLMFRPLVCRRLGASPGVARRP